DTTSWRATTRVAPTRVVGAPLVGALIRGPPPTPSRKWEGSTACSRINRTRHSPTMRTRKMTLSTPVQDAAQASKTEDASRHKNITKLIVATSVGNALEWFDISSYAYFALYISKAFFPANDPTTSLLLTFGTFGLSFLIRPIGGLVLGAYADRYGRKASLLVSIVLMTFGTLAVALMPTFGTIGILAPIAVITARLVQGFSAGGEFGSSAAFRVEHMPHRRGFIASWQFASQGVSQLLGSGFGVGLTAYLSAADLQGWGWRIPFLFGVLIGPVGLYIRSHIDDATEPPA